MTVQRKWEVMDSNGWSFKQNSNKSKQTTVLTVQFHLLWLFLFKRYIRLDCLVRTVHFCISGPFTFAYRSVFKSPVPFNFVHVRPLWVETAHFRRGLCNLNRSEFYCSIQKSQFFRKGQWKYHQNLGLLKFMMEDAISRPPTAALFRVVFYLYLS